MKLKYSLFLCLCMAFQLNAQLDFSKANTQHMPLLKQMDSIVASGKYEQITSVLVARNGQVLFEKYYNERTVDSKHNTRSATKTMATFLTGIAIDQGFINSEKDKIFTYLQHTLPVKNPDKRKDDITIEDLLTMTSVLECDDSNWHSRGHEERMYVIEDWTQFLVDLPVRSYPFGPKPEEAPYGRVFAYASAKAAAVSEIVQNAIKGDLVAFTKKNLFEPLGITDYTLHYTPKGILNTAGGSEYRSRDFLKLIQLCINDGKWNGEQIISSDWIKKASTPKVNVYDNVNYGYFLWLKSFGTDNKYKSYYMSGNGGNKVLACPELNLTVVITATNYNNRNSHNYTDELMDVYIVPSIVALKN
ncbi:serine hydrolase [Psychroserpens sp. SPM9]|uniref:serine hydrolase domain-containing protein n=1 Tax=Psychroserpens sp. SPM9 TaxID=2975598 RepID=UPI0021A929D9|nr:serine hydrolase [Psychroserpens sp. SPM9]MDG5492352.1 serine hydrolase [Psychroserpens sp. SPM9]